MPDRTYKVIELIGTSTDSWEKAAATVVELSAFGLSLGRSREHLGSSNTLSDSINAQFHDADLVRDHPQHIFDVPQIHGQRGNLNGYLFLSGLHRG